MHDSLRRQGLAATQRTRLDEHTTEAELPQYRLHPQAGDATTNDRKVDTGTRHGVSINGSVLVLRCGSISTAAASGCFPHMSDARVTVPEAHNAAAVVSARADEGAQSLGPLGPQPAAQLGAPLGPRHALPSALLWRSLYQLLLAVLMPFVWLRLAWRAMRIPALRTRWSERRGVLAQAIVPGGIWLHAVSAGEVIAAAPLIRRLRERHPAWPLLVTTTTHTGSERVQALLGDAVQHAYAPYDTAAAVRRFLATAQPRMAVFFETELWPNTIEACHQRGIRTLLVNGRLSARSARRYARLGAFTTRMLCQLDVIACQGADHAARFVQLGAPRTRTQALGNLKFDLQVDAALLIAGSALRREAPFADRPVWIAASTHAGEEAIVLAAHLQVRARVPRALLVLVPRHPERSAEVERLCTGWRVARRSRGAAPVSTDQHTEVGEVDIVLCDRIGELLLLYSTAQVAFVGGSLVDVGGHNLIEPAALGIPVLAGASDRNFADVVAQLRAVGALSIVSDADTLATEVCAVLQDPLAAARRAAAGREVVLAGQGATERVLQLFEA